MRITHIENDAEADLTGTCRFSAAMLRKLERKRKQGRGGWNDPLRCSVSTLCLLLREHVDKGDPVDIANLAMMIWNRQNPNG